MRRKDEPITSETSTKIGQSGSGGRSPRVFKMADRSRKKDIHHSVLSNKLVVSEHKSPTWKQHERGEDEQKSIK